MAAVHQRLSQPLYDNVSDEQRLKSGLVIRRPRQKTLQAAAERERVQTTSDQRSIVINSIPKPMQTATTGRRCQQPTSQLDILDCCCTTDSEDKIARTDKTNRKRRPL